mgnify:CR=1 FL=1
MPITLTEKEEYQIYDLPQLTDLLKRMMTLVNELEERIAAVERA